MKNIINHQLSNSGESQVINKLGQGVLFYDEKTHEEKIDLSDPQVRAKLLAPMALIESKYKTTPEKILTMLENI